MGSTADKTLAPFPCFPPPQCLTDLRGSPGELPPTEGWSDGAVEPQKLPPTGGWSDQGSGAPKAPPHRVLE